MLSHSPIQATSVLVFLLKSFSLLLPWVRLCLSSLEIWRTKVFLKFLTQCFKSLHYKCSHLSWTTLLGSRHGLLLAHFLLLSIQNLRFFLFTLSSPHYGCSFIRLLNKLSSFSFAHQGFCSFWTFFWVIMGHILPYGTSMKQERFRI